MTRTVAPTTDPMINHLLSSSSGGVPSVPVVVASVVVEINVVVAVVSSSVVVGVGSVVVVTFVAAYPGSDDTELAVALKSSTAKMGSSVAVVASNSCKKRN